jgi:hypothetical protein
MSARPILRIYVGAFAASTAIWSAHATTQASQSDKAPITNPSAASIGAINGKPPDKALESLNTAHENISVKNFGAVGDGVTDDTLAIQRGIVYASSRNTELLFPAGTYLFRPTLISTTFPVGHKYAFPLLSNMHLRGVGTATIKLADNVSTDMAPLRYSMFYTSTGVSNISLHNLTLDGNWLHNKISPNRAQHKYTAFNQAMIAVMGNNAYADDVTIDDCTFKNNSGQNNIIMGTTEVPHKVRLGQRWTITHTIHLDGGMDTNDFTAIYGYAEDVTVDHNMFYQTTQPKDWNGAGARNAYEVHGARQQFTNNNVRSYFGGVIVNSNWTRAVDRILIANNIFSDMFLYGIRLWRQDDGAGNVQSAISGVRILNNQIRLNSALYRTPTEHKAGLYAVGRSFAYKVTGVKFDGNTVIQEGGATNQSALAYFSDWSAQNQKRDGLEISRNRGVGIYNGAFCAGHCERP